MDAQAGYIAEYETELRLNALEAEWQRREMERKQKAAQQRQAARGGMRRRR